MHICSNFLIVVRPVHGPGFPVFGFFPDQPKRSLLVRDGLASHGSMAG